MSVLKFIFSKLKLWILVNYLSQNYASFAKLYLTLVLLKNHKQDTVLIYTMGKVGSTSILKSLKSQLQPYSIYHVHWLNKKNLIADKEFHKKHYDANRKNRVKVNVLPKYIIRGFYVSDLISNSNLGTDKHKVITLTRDPVARQVSSFFQNSKRFFGIDFESMNQSNEEVLERLMDVFLNDFIGKNDIDFLDASPLTWFDEEIKEVFNVDVYDSSFPKERGYALFKNGSVEILLIRLEDLNRCFREASYQLLGREVEIIKSKNAAEDKNYASIYAAFKNQLVLPQQYLDRMYESKYAKHFYSRDEILGFRTKWTGRL